MLQESSSGARRFAAIETGTPGKANSDDNYAQFDYAGARSFMAMSPYCNLIAQNQLWSSANLGDDLVHFGQFLNQLDSNGNNDVYNIACHISANYTLSCRGLAGNQIYITSSSNGLLNGLLAVGNADAYPGANYAQKPAVVTAVF